jgi:hypothetical protein
VDLDACGATPLTAASFPFADVDAGDSLSKVKIDVIALKPGGNPAALQFDPVTGHGYELVTASGTWADANAAVAAAARGGYLAVLDTPQEMQQVNDWFNLGAATGSNGTWIGAQQAADSASPGAGWSWVNGTPLDASAASPLWNNQGGAAEPNDADGTENNQENFGAIFEGTGTNLIYDAGATGSTEIQTAYLIEYDGALTTSGGTVVTPGMELSAADLAGGLTWNSVFNGGGTLTFAVADSQGAYSAPATLEIGPPAVAAAPSSQSLTSLVEDQHLSSLA